MRGTWSTTRCPAPSRTAQDAGTAHTCPTIRPCRACDAPRTHCDVPGCTWWVETGMPSNATAYRIHTRTEHHR